MSDNTELFEILLRDAIEGARQRDGGVEGRKRERSYNALLKSVQSGQFGEQLEKISQSLAASPSDVEELPSWKANTKYKIGSFWKRLDWCKAHDGLFGNTENEFKETIKFRAHKAGDERDKERKDAIKEWLDKAIKHYEADAADTTAEGRRECKRAISIYKAAKKAVYKAAKKAVTDQQISYAELPFYKTTTIANIMVEDGEGVWDTVIAIPNPQSADDSERALSSFNFKAGLIHQMNALKESNFFITPIPLTYLRFFMYVVRSEEDSFRLIEGPLRSMLIAHLMEKRKASRGKSREAYDEALSTGLLPPRFSHLAPSGGLIYKTHILYQNVIFAAEMSIRPDGNVEMLDDDPIIELDESMSEAVSK